MTQNLNSGIEQLNSRRQRRTRQAPPPKHPMKTAVQRESAAAAAEKTGHDATPSPDTTPETRQPAANGVRAPATTEAQPVSEPVRESKPAPAAVQSPSQQRPQPSAVSPAGHELPRLDVDLNDPDAHVVSPTVMSIPDSIVQRFEAERPNAPSHTAIVLNALRQHAHELPTLVLNRRPGPTPGDLFPWREAPGHTGTTTPLPLRIRPTKAELKVMKELVDWSSKRITATRPGARETNRSEMVAAALDAYLPPIHPPSTAGQKKKRK